MKTKFRQLEKRLYISHEFFAKICERNDTDFETAFSGSWNEYKSFLSMIADEIEFVARKLRDMRTQELEDALKDDTIAENLDVLVPLYAGGDYMFRSAVSKSGGSYVVTLRSAVRKMANLRKGDKVLVKIKRVERD